MTAQKLKKYLFEANSLNNTNKELLIKNGVPEAAVKFLKYEFDNNFPVLLYMNNLINTALTSEDDLNAFKDKLDKFYKEMKKWLLKLDAYVSIILFYSRDMDKMTQQAQADYLEERRIIGDLYKDQLQTYYKDHNLFEAARLVNMRELNKATRSINDLENEIGLIAENLDIEEGKRVEDPIIEEKMKSFMLESRLEIIRELLNLQVNVRSHADLHYHLQQVKLLKVLLKEKPFPVDALPDFAEMTDPSKTSSSGSITVSSVVNTNISVVSTNALSVTETPATENITSVSSDLTLSSAPLMESDIDIDNSVNVDDQMEKISQNLLKQANVTSVIPQKNNDDLNNNTNFNEDPEDQIRKMYTGSFLTFLNIPNASSNSSTNNNAESGIIFDLQKYFPKALGKLKKLFSPMKISKLLICLLDYYSACWKKQVLEIEQTELEWKRTAQSKRFDKSYEDRLSCILGACKAIYQHRCLTLAEEKVIEKLRKGANKSMKNLQEGIPKEEKKTIASTATDTNNNNAELRKEEKDDDTSARKRGP